MVVNVEQQGTVALVTFQNPDKMNSFDTKTLAKLNAVFDDILADDAVRAIVLTGSGRVFCAGADVAEFKRTIEEGTARQFLLDATAALHPLMMKLYQSPKPFVAAVNGVAAGGGLGLALVADARIGSAAARFAASYFGIGVSPDGGSTWLMPRIIGVQRTRKFFLNNEVMGAEEALKTGMLDEISDDCTAAAVALAEKWGAWAQHSRNATNQLLDSQAWNDFGTQLDEERVLMAEAGDSADFAEGVEAFFEKRKPNFQ